MPKSHIKVSYTFNITTFMVFYPNFFLGIHTHISTVYLSETVGPPPWLGALSENVLEVRVSTLT